jgi:PIN domain nuclease of toxin-antitoxin system
MITESSISPGARPKERSICCVSTLEIAGLVAGGDIIFKIPLQDWVERTLTDLRMESIPVSHETLWRRIDCPSGLRLATADDRILEWEHVASMDARK